MTTDSHNHIDAMLHVQPDTPHSVPQEMPPLQKEEEKLLPTLQDLSFEGKNFVQILEDRLDSMQKIFMDMLNSQLKEYCLQPEELLQLSLSSTGTLQVDGNAHDAAILHKILAQQPSLQQQFQEMAQIALLSHGMDITVQACNSLFNTQEEQETPPLEKFHMCVKGTLSHCYIR